MKLYSATLVVLAILAAFFLGGIVNFAKPAIGLICVVVAALLISYGYFIRRGN